MSLFALRLVSIGVVALLARMMDSSTFLFSLSLIGLVHYGVAFVYSRFVAKKMLHDSRTRWPFITLVILVALATWLRWPNIVYFFAFHHVMSEVFTAEGIHPDLAALQRDRNFCLFRYAFHALCYVAAVQPSFPRLFYINSTMLLWLTLTVGVWYFLQINEKLPASPTRSDLLRSETLFLVVTLGSVFHTIGFASVLFYHFVFWALFPLNKLKVFGPTAIAKYTATTIAMVVVVCLSFAAMAAPKTAILKSIAKDGFQYLTIIGFIHIGLSLALSRQNPRALLNVFYPAKPA